MKCSQNFFSINYLLFSNFLSSEATIIRNFNNSFIILISLESRIESMKIRNFSLRQQSIIFGDHPEVFVLPYTKVPFRAAINESTSTVINFQNVVIIVRSNVICYHTPKIAELIKYTFCPPKKWSRITIPLVHDN